MWKIGGVQILFKRNREVASFNIPIVRVIIWLSSLLAQDDRFALWKSRQLPSFRIHHLHLIHWIHLLAGPIDLLQIHKLLNSIELMLFYPSKPEDQASKFLRNVADVKGMGGVRGD